MIFELYNTDNMYVNFDHKFDLIFSDMIYENKDLSWIEKYWSFLKENGIFIVMTDWHTNYLVREKLESLGYFINHLVYKCEWGNHPKNKFHQCYDDIIIFSNSKNYKFYPDRIQVDKITKNKGLNPSGRETKTATAWIDDICLTTTSRERIKKDDGHLIQWQKPMKLMDRLLSPFTNENDWILDPFLGSGTTGEWCRLNNRNFIGIEYDKEVFEIAKRRLNE